MSFLTLTLSYQRVNNPLFEKSFKDIPRNRNFDCGVLSFHANNELYKFIAFAPNAPSTAEVTAITIFRILFHKDFFKASNVQKTELDTDEFTLQVPNGVESVLSTNE